MENPKVTIIVPCFNQADTLTEALDSALNQTVACEVICINDGSTDLTRQVLMEYEDRVKVINQTNKGLPGARNTGIMNASGDWILPLDSDDVLEPNYVERVQQVIKDVPEATVIAPSFKTFGLSASDVLLQMRPTVGDFQDGNRIGYCSAIRKDALLEVGGYNPRMVFGWEDYDLWIELAKRGKVIVTIPEYLWRYRTRANSMITVANQHAEELKDILRRNHRGFYV